jgi:phosphoribosylaminoimidazole (AIR) synthetase
LLRHAKVTTTLDLYSQSIDASKLDAQKDMAMAIASAGTHSNGFTGEELQMKSMYTRD